MDEKFMPGNPPTTGTVAVVPGPNQSSTPNVKVWLVDDNEELRKLVAELLSHQGGIECPRHFSSPDALLSELASKPGPDVILLDVQMGDRNGLDAVRPIRSLTRSTRVMMFTTCYDRAWKNRALSDGASEYLLKSTPLENVAERIRCVVHEPVPNLYPRRRFNCSAERPMPSHQANSLGEKSPRLLSRTLKKLRLW